MSNNILNSTTGIWEKIFSIYIQGSRPGIHFLIVLCFFQMSMFSQVNDTVILTMDEAVNIALNNNLLLKNSSLKLELNTKKSSGPITLAPTEINYKFGQLYSEENDNYLEINQHFGSVLTHIRLLKQAGIRQSVANAEQEIIKAELIAKVRSAYIFWQYCYVVSGTFAEENDLYSRLTEIADLRYKTGDISLLERTSYMAEASFVEDLYLNSIDDIRIAENKLHQLLLDSGNYFLPVSEMELYQIAKETDTSYYSGNKYLDLYHNHYLLARSDQLVVSSRFFPELNAGIFTQDITGLNRLYGGQIGLSIPLWIPENKADKEIARIESEMAQNEFEYQRKSMIYEVENLVLELNKYFRQIRYFETNSLLLSRVLIDTAAEQLDKEEIDYAEYLGSISRAYKIRREYYKVIMDYNQTALKLEIYAD